MPRQYKHKLVRNSRTGNGIPKVGIRKAFACFSNDFMREINKDEAFTYNGLINGKPDIDVWICFPGYLLDKREQIKNILLFKKLKRN